jgi:hypothetical protein
MVLHGRVTEKLILHKQVPLVDSPPIDRKRGTDKGKGSAKGLHQGIGDLTDIALPAGIEG